MVLGQEFDVTLKVHPFGDLCKVKKKDLIIDEVF